jgi:hypothetical protein
LSKIVATIFCPTLSRSPRKSLCCQIKKNGHVVIKLYAEERIPGVETHFFQGDLDRKINNLKARDRVVTGKTNDEASSLFVPIRVCHQGKDRLAFGIKFDGYSEFIYVLKTDLLTHLSWLQAKRRAYLRQAA